MGRSLKYLLNINKIIGLTINGCCPLTTHSQFIDDIIFDISSSGQSLTQCLNNLHTYEHDLGREINRSKSKLFGINIFDQFLSKMDMTATKIPSVYLGQPLVIDGNIGEFWDFIIAKMRENMSS